MAYWSSIESWRREGHVEDRRIKGAAVGQLEWSDIGSFADLQKRTTNKPPSSIGHGEIPYEDRVFLLIYFPREGKTPPSHMFFHKCHVVGNLVDRLCAMLSMLNSTATLDDPKRMRLFCLRTGQELPPGKTLGDLGLRPHEPVVLEQGLALPSFYPAGSPSDSPDPVSSNNTPASPPPPAPSTQPDDPQPAPSTAATDDYDVDPALAGEAPVALSAMKFGNKRLQPLGDPKTPSDSRVQLAVFFPVSSGAPPLYMYFDKKWVAGRCLDSAMTRGSVPNPNLSTTDPSKKLVFYSLRTCKRLNPSTPIGDAAASGDAVLIAPASGIPPCVVEETRRYLHPTKDFEKEAKAKLRECIVM